MPTAAQKRAKKKYDDTHMAYQSIKISKELLAEFRAVVAARGDKVNTVLKQAMIDYIAANSATAPPQDN